MSVDHLPYRRGVGIALFNDKHQVFVGERIDSPGAWQMPQGGIDDGEDLETAFYREMQEEIGTDKATIIKVMDKPLLYDLPPELQQKLWGGIFRGQEQTWIAARFTGGDADIKLDAHEPQEFQRWQWVDLDKVVDLIVPFKREIYTRIAQDFHHTNF
ncbi:MAG: Adenosine (5)-pentaphospho-(5)-adenosine pyrophosphohydrolase [Micavibrio sp.]|nr:Adenosine (5)-pentaphospho-(5)-adenosine pyrophosphohydrolase [Micavibrio sp.]